MNKQKRYSFGCISREESFRVYGTQILKRLAGNRLEPVSVAAPRDKVRQHPVLVVEKRLGRINLGHYTFSMTIMRSESMTVSRRCAMVKTVQ